MNNRVLCCTIFSFLSCSTIFKVEKISQARIEKAGEEISQLYTTKNRKIQRGIFIGGATVFMGAAYYAFNRNSSEQSGQPDRQVAPEIQAAVQNSLSADLISLAKFVTVSASIGAFKEKIGKILSAIPGFVTGQWYEKPEYDYFKNSLALLLANIETLKSAAEECDEQKDSENLLYFRKLLCASFNDSVLNLEKIVAAIDFMAQKETGSGSTVALSRQHICEAVMTLGDNLELLLQGEDKSYTFTFLCTRYPKHIQDALKKITQMYPSLDTLDGKNIVSKIEIMETDMKKVKEMVKILVDKDKKATKELA